jgi:hypothetical protein
MGTAKKLIEVMEPDPLPRALLTLMVNATPVASTVIRPLPVNCPPTVMNQKSIGK